MVDSQIRTWEVLDQRVLDTVALLEQGRTREVGPVLTAGHASMRDDFEITVPRVDIGNSIRCER